MLQNLQNVAKLQKFQLNDLVEFEKCCKTHISLQKSVPIQPKTSNILPKFCQKLATTLRVVGALGQWPGCQLAFLRGGRDDLPRPRQSRDVVSSGCQRPVTCAFSKNAFFENAFFENFANFWRARSRLYQSEILQVHMRSTASFKLNKMCTLLHRSKLNILAKHGGR